MQFVDLATQQQRIRPQLEAAMQRVMDHGKYILGPEVFELEKQLAAFAGSRQCISCSSGTDALLMGLMAWDVGPGDAVFTTPFSFFATAEVIVLTGATPVFVDIDPVSYNIDPDSLAEAIEQVRQDGKLTPRGIIPVDLFGLAADYDRIQPLAAAHDLFVLQDAAQSFGAEYNGKKAPAHAPIGATSFFPAKPLGCYGDGGACFTDDEALADQLRSVRVHGQGVDKYTNVRIGINGRLDTLQAAVLLEKLTLYPEEVEQRNQVAAWYTEAIAELNREAGTERILAPTVPDGSRSVWAQYTVQAEDRESIRSRLQEAGIPSAVYYTQPMHLLEAMAHLEYQPGAFPVAERASERVFSLPMHPYLDQETIAGIVRVMGDG